MAAVVGCKIPMGLVTAMQEAGLSPSHVLASARLPSRLLDVPGRYVSPSEYFALWRAIRAVSGNPNIGIVLATSVKPELTEPLFLAILSAVNLAGAIAVVSRFKRLLEPEDLIVVNDDVSKRLVVRYDWPECGEDVPQALVDAELAFLVAVGRRGTGYPELSPQEISMCASELDAGATHADFFQCAIRLNASSNGLAFAVDDTQRPFVTHNPQLLTALLPYLQANTPPSPKSGVARVRSVIAERVRGQRPDADTVARELAMSTRAMQRLLKDNGTSFRQVLDEVRNEHARGYLSSTAFSDGEVSFLLGFEDPNSFYRAFRSWNGMSPSEFRRQSAPSV
jgi:AraC-like DNA-binding protein